MLKNGQEYLNAVVAVRVPQELLKPRAVQELLDQHLPRAMFGDTNTLHTISKTNKRSGDLKSPSQ